MNLYVVCSPRSRSWFILNSLCQHLRLENLGEYFGKLYFNLAKNQGIEGFKNYIEACKSFNYTNSGVKIFLQNLISHEYWQSYDSKLVLVDFSKTFKITDEDKIIILHRRDYINQVASYLYAQHTKKFVYLSKLEFKKQIVNLDLKDPIIVSTIRLILSNEILVDRMKDLLYQQGKSFNQIEYSEALEYLENQNIPQFNLTIDNNINYRDFIENYSDLADIIENEKSFVEKTLDWIRLK